jgi:hypothetical protein
MKSKGVVAASIRSSRGPAGGGSCALLVANTSTCRQFRRGHLRCPCGTDAGAREVTGRRAALGPEAAGQTVGTVPPSITYSVPVIDAARGETKKAMRSATSFGFASRPSGMPPRLFMMICLPPS